MADIIIDTMALLTEYSRTHSSVLVSYSGGKESRVTLDLCSRSFERVVCFFMYIAPGLAVEEEALDFARTRYGVEVLYYPHWAAIQFMRHGIYCEPNSKMPTDYTLSDIYALARADTGIKLIANGNKKADSEFRRKNIAAFLRQDVMCPLKEWNKFSVLRYLKMQGIPIPVTKPGKTEGAIGVDLSAPALCRLHDNHPEDFKTLLKWFPYADAAIAKRNFFGVT